MKKKARTYRTTPPAKRTPPQLPLADDRWAQFLDLCEQYRLSPIIQNSYVLSRFWAWFSRIQVNPKVRIPVPRFLSYRDP